MNPAPRKKPSSLAYILGQDLAQGRAAFEDVIAALVDGYASVSSAPAALTRIEALDRIEATAGSLLGDVVDDGRFQGLAWSAIASALGMTRQGAWDKYHRREDLPQKP